MLLKNIVKKIEEEGLLVKISGNIDNLQVTNITFDSRKACCGSLFTCKGKQFEVKYLEDAKEKGACAYLSELEYNVDLPNIIVSDIRKAMSIVAIYFYCNPSDSFNLVGITGTKGKTTTSFFLTNIFDEYTKSKNASITTIEVETGKGKKKAVLTTPEAYDLQEIFAEVRSNNVKFLTMEVSSQALKVDRVYGEKYNVGIFLNIGDDHISPNEHPDWNDYYESKLKLFSMCDMAVINADDSKAKNTIERAKRDCKLVYTYGRSENSDFIIRDIRKKDEYFEFDVKYGDEELKTYVIAMHGEFNCSNALAAIITAKYFGIDDESIQRGLIKTLVPGRMDVFYNKEKDVVVIVDFAHNKLSFINLFESIKSEFANRRLGVVIGSAGGKGFQRRKAIGECIDKYADYAVLTDCDSNFEDTQSICNDILQNVNEKKNICSVILDREEAIITTLKNARPGDVVALVARGEETRRWWKGNILECTSDVELARRYSENDL